MEGESEGEHFSLIKNYHKTSPIQKPPTSHHSTTPTRPQRLSSDKQKAEQGIEVLKAQLEALGYDDAKWKDVEARKWGLKEKIDNHKQENTKFLRK